MMLVLGSSCLTGLYTIVIFLWKLLSHYLACILASEIRWHGYNYNCKVMEIFIEPRKHKDASKYDGYDKTWIKREDDV